MKTWFNSWTQNGSRGRHPRRSAQQRSFGRRTLTAHFEPLEKRELLSVSPDSVFGFGGASADQVADVAMDSLGNSYLTGQFSGTVDFDPGPGITELSDGRGYVSKYAPAGELVWAKPITGNVNPFAVTVDKLGAVYLTGQFSGTVDFDPDPVNVYSLTASADGGTVAYDYFTLKLQPDGNFGWANSFSRTSRVGNSGDRGSGIAIDDRDANAANWKVYTVGESIGDGMIAKLNANSGTFVWTKFIKPSNRISEPQDIVLDDAGNLYVTGTFHDRTTFGSITLTAAKQGNISSTDVFVTRMTPAGDFVWAVGMGGPGRDGGADIAYANNSLTVVGSFGDEYRPFGNSTFSAKFGATTLNSNGGADAFVTRLDLSGNILWARGFGGVEDDSANAVGIRTSDEIYTSGDFRQSVAFGAQTIASAGESDGFFSQLDASGNFVSTWRMGGVGVDNARGLGVDSTGRVVAVGSFRATADFPSGQMLTSAGSIDVFVMTFAPSTSIATAEGSTSPNASVNSLLASTGLDQLLAEPESTWTLKSRVRLRV